MYVEKPCPFCSSEIKENTFFESANFLAIYNVAPILPGHSLVIPKLHITSFMELTENELFEIVSFSRKTIKILSLAFETTAFNWTIQEKEEAGQTIAHMHIHIVPRIPRDLPNPGDWHTKLKHNIESVIDSDLRPNVPPHELKSIVLRLRSFATNI